MDLRVGPMVQIGTVVLELGALTRSTGSGLRCFRRGFRVFACAGPECPVRQAGSDGPLIPQHGKAFEAQSPAI